MSDNVFSQKSKPDTADSTSEIPPSLLLLPPLPLVSTFAHYLVIQHQHSTGIPSVLCEKNSKKSGLYDFWLASSGTTSEIWLAFNPGGSRLDFTLKSPKKYIVSRKYRWRSFSVNGFLLIFFSAWTPRDRSIYSFARPDDRPSPPTHTHKFLPWRESCTSSDCKSKNPRFIKNAHPEMSFMKNLLTRQISIHVNS